MNFNRFAAATIGPAPKIAAGRARTIIDAQTRRVAKAASKPGHGSAGGEGKAARSATSTTGLRFAHWADSQHPVRGTTEREAAASRIPALEPLSSDISAAHGGRVAALRQALAHGMKTQGEIDAEDRQARETARFIMNAAAKARGEKPATPAAPVKPDMSTPEGAAAFVMASVAKLRRGRR